MYNYIKGFSGRARYDVICYFRDALMETHEQPESVVEGLFNNAVEDRTYQIYGLAEQDR